MRGLNKLDKSTVPNRGTKGFSLIELLVVVAVILIIAAIAVPNFINSRMRANEASAVQSLRNICTAQMVYSTTWGVGFADTLPKLSGNGVVVDQNNAGLIDSVLGAGLKSGYVFTLTPGATDSNGNVLSFTLTADPQVPGSSGVRHFYADQTSAIRFNPSVPAGPSDLPIN